MNSRWFQRFLSVVLLVLPGSFFLNPPCLAKDKPRDPGADIDKAVERGVSYLKSKQGKNGSWDAEGHETGATALAVYALLKAKSPVADRAVSSGIESLLNASICSNSSRAATYDVSLVAVALSSAIESAGEKNDNPAPNVDLAACRQKLQEATDWLVAAQHDCRAENRFNRIHRTAKRPAGDLKPAELAGGGYDLAPYCGADGSAWGYRLADSNYVDNSNTQFALLGLRAAQNIHDYYSGTNIAIPREVWERALARLASGQAASGEWDYGTPTLGARGFQGTMTAAGVGGVVICLSSLIDKPDLEKIARTPEILKGLGRLEKYMYPPPNTLRFDAAGLKPPDRSGYILYSLERACMLGGFKKLGSHDWYTEGAADLVRAQQSDGSWSGGAWYSASDSRHKAPKSRDNTIETSFSLLFLTKGYVYTPAQRPYSPSDAPGRFGEQRRSTATPGPEK